MTPSGVWLARNDYAANAGAVQLPGFPVQTPTYLNHDSYPWWPLVARFNGVIYIRSEVRLAEATDGTSTTFLAGEEYLEPERYFDGQVVGVAPGARLWAVKVLNRRGSGWLSDILEGVDYVTQHAAEIEVANMSLGGQGPSGALNAAIAASVRAGVVYAVAAGNSAADASTFSPANHPDVITVSALADSDGLPGGLGPDFVYGNGKKANRDKDDTLADFSNYGPLVEVAAPAVRILSTFPGGGLAYGSGTSMAAPHVAGAAALLVASGMADPFLIRQTIIDTGNFNWTDDSADGIQEPLLDVSNTEVYSPATVPPPLGGTSGDGAGGGRSSSRGEPAAVQSRGAPGVDWSGLAGDPVLAHAETQRLVFIATDNEVPIVAEVEINFQTFAGGGRLVVGDVHQGDVAATPWFIPGTILVYSFESGWFLLIDLETGEYDLHNSFLGVDWEGEGRLILP
jgi:subtilisin family serine protease